MELYLYHPKFNELIQNYYLPDEQLHYSATPKESIEVSKEDKDRYPVLGIDNNELVVFFILHENDGVRPYSGRENAVLLRSFSTNYKHQGQGYAKQSLQQLPDFMRVHLPHIDTIVLAVNVNNTAAQSLYKKSGYIDEGVRVEGAKGELIVMNYYL